MTHTIASSLTSPAALRRRLDQLLGQRDEQQRQRQRIQDQLREARAFLELAPPVTEALKSLSEKLFEQELKIVEEQLTHALHDVLEQPMIRFRARPDFKGGAAVVEFSIERDGNAEDIQRGQGGSVQNILSTGLRMFALATLSKARHRGFLVLDEQDCWLRPELVSRWVKIVRDVGGVLGLQVLMISHHDLALFERYADRILQLQPQSGGVRICQLHQGPWQPDV